MARAALNWTAPELGRKANVTANAVHRFEGGKGVQASTVAALQRALEAAGVRFIEDAEHVGVMIPRNRD